MQTPILTSDMDNLCPYRRCYQVGENKGTFVHGRGYTSYHKTPIKVCMIRHLHGCPSERGVFETKGEETDSYKVHVRPMPDWAKIIGDMDAEVKACKASQKVQRIMRRMLATMKEQYRYLGLYRESLAEALRQETPKGETP